ncbi:MAG: hypothetical protein V3U84_08115 [Thiotrichaceae bacterium]
MIGVKRTTNIVGKTLTLITMLVCSPFAGAETVTLTSLMSNPANTFISGNLIFNNFSASPAGGSTTLDFNQVTVTNLMNDGTNGAGIQFDIVNGMLDLPSGHTANLLLEYRVTTSQALSTARLAFGGCNSNPVTDTDCAGVSKTGSGLAVLDQNVQYNGTAVNNIIDNGKFTYFEKNIIPTTRSHPSSVTTTYVSLSGGTGHVSLTSFEDRYNVTSPGTDICGIPPVSIGGNCDKEIIARSMSDLEAYTTSNFGSHTLPNGKRSFKNLRLIGELGQTSMPLNVSSPCTIIVNAGAFLTGSNITLHARQGLNVNWSAGIDASGEACLISDKQHVLLNGGNVVHANTLAIRGAKKAIVGYQSALIVNAKAELISTGLGDDSLAKVGNKTVITARNFTMLADNAAELAYKADVSTTGKSSIISGSLPSSETLLTNRSSVQAGSDLILSSGGKTNIGFHATLTTGGNLEVTAKTVADCSIASITSTSYSSKSGSCATKIP